jgi:hypothetical protein
MSGAPKLIALSEQIRGKTFELTQDKYTVGRVDERDICIKDPTISSFHCDLIKTGETYTIVDHNSTNGSRVNNIPIKEQELQNSDILQLGSVELLFDSENKAVTAVSKTQTGINLDGIDIGTTTVKKMTNFSPIHEEKKTSPNYLKFFVTILILVILGLIGYIVQKIG